MNDVKSYKCSVQKVASQALQECLKVNNINYNTEVEKVAFISAGALKGAGKATLGVGKQLMGKGVDVLNRNFLSKSFGKKMLTGAGVGAGIGALKNNKKQYDENGNLVNNKSKSVLNGAVNGALMGGVSKPIIFK